MANSYLVHALKGEQLTLLSPDFATRSHIDAYFAGHRVAPRITVEANSIQGLTETLQRTPSGHRPARRHHPRPPTPRPLPLDPPLPARTVTLLHRQGTYRSAATRAFVLFTYDLVHTRGSTPPP
ncbi:LysR substrate-binding domain-containing protein [Streptomyces sp. NPDC001153]